MRKLIIFTDKDLDNMLNHHEVIHMRTNDGQIFEFMSEKQYERLHTKDSRCDLRKEKNMSYKLNWAKREVEIACKKEKPNRKEEEFDYGCACYESALKAFESLCKDGHSGFSIKMTQAILVHLLDGKPLTAIEDTDDAWNLCPHITGIVELKNGRIIEVMPSSITFCTGMFNDYCLDEKG